MGDLDNIESYSYSDLSMIFVTLHPTVDEDDVEQHWDMLRRKVGDAKSALPEGASTPIVKDDFGEVYGMFYALTGDGFSDREMADYAELIKREVGDLEGVNRVEIYGKRATCINISLLQEKMANLGVMPVEVLITLRNQNNTSYSGYYDNGDNRIRVTVTDRFRTAEDISNMLIQGHEDDQLKISDIAMVEEAYEQPTRNQMYYDGERALGLLIASGSAYDVVKVGEAVNQCMERLKEERLPAGIQVQKVFYQPDRVTDALKTFAVNLVESVIIVVGLLMIFMGFKSGMIIGISLLVTVMGSFLFLLFGNGTLQRVSLASFILAMGMLVDNAIVIIDGVLVDLKAGKPRHEALTSIGRQTAFPLLGATVIAILAFLPIYMSPDTTGDYVRDLFIVLAVSLLLSWVLALLHVPLMADRYLHPEVEENQTGRREYKGRFYEWQRKLLKTSLTHQKTFVAFMVGMLLLSGIGYLFLKQSFFPDLNYNQLYVEYKLPEGSNYTKVERDLKAIEAYLRTRKEVTHVVISTGGTPGRYNLVRSLANPSLAYGELIVDFESPKKLVQNYGEIQQYLSDNYPEAYVAVKRYNLMYKKYPIEVQFSGPDPAVLHRLTDSVMSIMRQTPQVRLVTTDWEPKVPVVSVEYDQPSARALGLSRADVSMSLLSATGGIPIGTFYQGIHSNTIYVKCVADRGEPIENLSNAQVFSQTPLLDNLLSQENLLKLRTGSLDKSKIIEELTQTIPLHQVTKRIDVDWEDPVVYRYNGQRSQRAQCSPVMGVEAESARKLLAEKVEQITLPEGYTMQWQGERAASVQSTKYLFMYFPFAIILMIAILIMLFKDYKKPLIIFCTIPMVLIGVVLGMWVSGLSFGFVAMVGVLGLIGMIIKNGIVLMDEINLQITQGVEPHQALIDSSQSRLRPVMMAALTTILGMIPLLTDAMFGSLAATIMGGLLVGTVITLFFIPVLYALFFNIKNPEK